MSDSAVRYRTVWISDIHLGSRACKVDLLLDFLQRVKCDRLYLVGDVIDFWALKRRLYWPKRHQLALRKIIELAGQGTEVIYIPGNHDEIMRDYAGLELLGIALHLEHVHVTADGKRLLVLHGDRFDHICLGPSMTRLIGCGLYAALSVANRYLSQCRRVMGFPYWSLATYIKGNLSATNQLINRYAKTVSSDARQQGFDGVVCGHIHQPQILENDRFIYCNDGDWTESCSALTETFTGALHLVEWTVEQNAREVERGLPRAA